MTDKNFSSANKDISIQGAKGQKLNPKQLLGGMAKDTKKRWYMVFGAMVIGIMALMTWVSATKQVPTTPPKKEAATIDTSPKGISTQKDWKAQTGAEMIEMKKQMDASASAQRELLAQVTAMRQDMLKRATEPAGGVAGMGAPGAQSGLNLTLPPPPTPPASITPQLVGSTPSLTPPPSPSSMGFPSASDAPAAAPKRSPARSFIPPESAADAAAKAGEQVVEEMVQNDRKGFLPAGSFADATLISGVEAFTGGTAQQQPQPIVIRLDANAVLPNAANYQIKGCHVLASVWGDMSAERVFGRLATLTCVDTSNRLVLSEEVEGVLVDSDGKNGIRGQLLDRQGAKLARSLLAGFAQGISSAFGSAQSTTTQTAFGLTSAMVGSNAVKAGGYSGASTAAQQLADFYLKQAEATLPVIAVDAGRKVSVLFTKSKALKFETTDSYRVKPQDKLMVQHAVVN
jgi:conjugal transfer pilus assembly protein TraB